MKYHVYTKEPGKITTLVETDSLKKAAKAYYGLIVSCACPRLSIDGRELRIYEADKMVYRSVRNAAGVMHNAQVRNEILKARKQA
jgi:hypothetical protein